MKELTLEITNKCHQNCPWCSSNSVPNGYLVPDNKIYTLLKEHRAECNVVRFSGGEPTLHPEIGGFLWYAKERLGYKTILLTNGSKYFAHDDIDEYWVNIVGSSSIRTSLNHKLFGRSITMHALLVKGNEVNIRNAIQVGIDHEIPVRLLVLQKQGRGVNCKPLDLITWTGNKGCPKEGKVTITPKGKIVTCSALKYGECSLLVGGKER